MSTPTKKQVNHLQYLLDHSTPGEWSLGNENDSGAEFCIGDGSTSFSTCRFDRWTEKDVYTRQEMLSNVNLAIELHNLAPALLEAARENLRLREAMNLILKKVVGTQALIENEATEEALSTVEFCLQDISTIISHPHLVRELNQKETA